MSRDRILTVSMVSDTVPNVRRFVRRTLASGVDHMLIFLDAERPDVQAMLEQHSSVTVVRTQSDYWHHERPNPLPDRQMINANLTLTALAAVQSAGWLFHIDADEALAFDRDEFLELNPRAARFQTLEAVARRVWKNDEPSLFKKIPTPQELDALAGLGVIEVPQLDAFFRGHYLGKTGVRPGRDVRFRVHSVYELPHVPIETELPTSMHLLHYASYSMKDFVARWRDFDPANAAGRPYRSAQMGTAFHTIRNHPSPSRLQRRRMLGQLFDRKIADDVATLSKFGLLVDDPRSKHVPPRPLPAADLRMLEEALADLYLSDKDPFRSEILQIGKRTAGSR